MERKLFGKVLLPFLILSLFTSASRADGASVVLKVGPSSLGKIVVNGKGMSAYFFDLDKANSGVSVCSGECAANWPAITSATAKPSVSGIKGKVGTIAVKGGEHQVTINGRPIYTFAFDTKPGQAMGQGAQGVWYVISPTGNEIKVLKLASKSTPQPTKASAYGRSNY